LLIVARPAQRGRPDPVYLAQPREPAHYRFELMKLSFLWTWPFSHFAT
jgi:hypothetical protein